MAKPVKNVPIDRTAQDVIDSLSDAQTAQDSRVLVDMMHRISGHEPKVWNVATIGFDSYHYKYESGREGDAQAISFYPRDGKITIYLMGGTEMFSDLLAKLGKHTTSRVCVYIKRLSDVDLAVLEELITQSYKYVKAKDGNMHRAVNEPK